MNPEEYANAQALISAAAANYALQFGQMVSKPALSIEEWLMILRLMFEQIAKYREESAALARSFYDSQREFYHPDLDANARLLEPYEFSWFVENMEPARKKMSQEDSPADAVGTLALRAVREVENGGRKQIIHAVQEEPDSKVIRGWARVATGRETCAWCLMLVSRGPVYYSAQTAGLDLDPASAAEMIAAGEDVSEFMEQWHDGCDCKVVPVFKHEDWPGQAAADRASELWVEASKAARALMDSEPDRVHPSGKKKGRPFTFNETTINVLRQMLESGEIDSSEWAATAAA